MSELVREIAAVGDHPPREAPYRLCRLLEHSLPVDAVTMSLLTDTPARQMLGASNKMATAVEEIQFTVLEGPCIAAAASGEPVHLTDWTTGSQQWPLFVSTLRERWPDIAAIHAFPMWFGDYCLGSVDFISRVPGGMPTEAVEQAAEAVDALGEALLPAQGLLAGHDEEPLWEPADLVRAHWSDTHKAVGIVMLKTGVSAEAALAMMRAQAFATGRTLAEITVDILAS
ncbi:GAF and ANTAR domain-containing protein [Streptomyces sp. NPDC102487]|uniref:GAF and ANTAR domain-containing protein n=1 Tax=Streptomyces sp. NPDC102487 TaxID=3366182 RepID=UPI00382621F3